MIPSACSACGRRPRQWRRRRGPRSQAESFIPQTGAVVLEIAEVEYNSDRYLDLVNLRRRVLRAPLGLDFTSEQLAGERTDIHLAAYLGGELVGCAILTPIDPSRGVVKLRQMAIEPDRQGCGVGAQIVAFAEHWSVARGYRQIILRARESAVGFYEKAGYAAIGQIFIEVTIPHREMAKQLAKVPNATPSES